MNAGNFVHMAWPPRVVPPMSADSTPQGNYTLQRRCLDGSSCGLGQSSKFLTMCDQRYSPFHTHTHFAAVAGCTLDDETNIPVIGPGAGGSGSGCRQWGLHLWAPLQWESTTFTASSHVVQQTITLAQFLAFVIVHTLSKSFTCNNNHW